MIQPHLPIRLPCYDFTLIINPTFDCCLQALNVITECVSCGNFFAIASSKASQIQSYLLCFFLALSLKFTQEIFQTAKCTKMDFFKAEGRRNTLCISRPTTQKKFFFAICGVLGYLIERPVSSQASGVTDSHGVTGGVYKARERIHRGILIRDY